MKETISSTTEYDVFKMMKGNRAIDHRHVAHLKAAISENNMLEIRPIIINDDFEVIDGQHRLQAARELGVPIYYITRDDLSIEDAQVLNSNTKNWSSKAYLDSYVAQGNKEYLMLQGFIKKWNISIGEGLHLLGQGTRNYHQFAHGHFKCKNYMQAERTMEMVYDYEKYYAGFKRRAFVLAVANLAEHPNYDHAQMMKKLEFQSTAMVDCTNTTAYLKLLERIYNFKAREIVHFDIQKHAADQPREGGKFAKKEKVTQ